MPSAAPIPGHPPPSIKRLSASIGPAAVRLLESKRLMLNDRLTMKTKIKSAIRLCGVLILIHQVTVIISAQTVPSSRISQDKSDGDGMLSAKSKREIGPPFRYVVVYDDLQTEESDDGRKIPLTRDVTVLMNEKDFSESNLIVLFNYLSRYYSVPTYLTIEVHTSLETIETLEERNKRSSDDIGRSKFEQIYKTAGYSRFFDGTEIFSYYSGTPGKFIRKFVELGTTKVNDTKR